jgi:WD40 repeat protein
MLHDLQRDVLVREAGDLGMSAMHGSLLWSLAKRCCGVSDKVTRVSLSDVDWSSLVRCRVDDRAPTDAVLYGRQHLSYHLGAVCERTTVSESDASAASALSDARRALVHDVALNVAWIVGRCVCSGSVAGAVGDVAAAERVINYESHARRSDAVPLTSASVRGALGAPSTAELRVLGWVRRALELSDLVIRRDIARCASYLWASLEPVTRACDDVGARQLLDDVVRALDVCRRKACVDAGGGWLAVSSAGEMSAASALVCSLPGHGGTVRCVAVGCMNDAGRCCIVSGADDATVRVWDLGTFECVHELKGHRERVSCVSDVFVGADGRHMVASGSEDKSVRLWDVGGGTCVRMLEGHTDWVVGLSRMFTDDERRRCVASCSFDMSIRVWDVDTGACIGVLTGHEKSLECVSVVGTVDSRLLLASGSYDCTVRLWNIATQTCVGIMRGHTDWVWCVSDGMSDAAGASLVASGSADHTVRLWNTRLGECVRVLSGHGNYVNIVTCGIRVDGRLVLASGSGDGSVRLWDIDTGACVAVVAVSGGPVWTVSDSVDDGARGGDSRVFVATGSFDGVVRVWDARSAVRSHSSTRGNDRLDTRADVTCVSNGFAADCGCMVALGCADGAVAVWNADAGERVRDMSGHTRAVISVTSGFCNASGTQLIASGSEDKTLRLWDVGTGVQVHALTGHSDWVTTVSSGFGDAGTEAGRVLIASGSNDTTVRLWDVDSGMCTRVLAGHTAGVRCISECFSDVGTGRGRRFIASGLDDKTARVWDVSLGECVHVLSEHCERVTSVSGGIVDDRGGVLVASASGDKTIRLFDAATGACARTLAGHSHFVRSVSGGFVDASGCRCIASTSKDITLRVWDVSTGAEVSVVSANEEMGFSCARRAWMVSVVSNGGRCRLAMVAGERLVVIERLLGGVAAPLWPDDGR